MNYKLYFLLSLFLFSCSDSENINPNKKTFDQIEPQIQALLNERKGEEAEIIYNSYFNTDSMNYKYYLVGGDIQWLKKNYEPAVELYRRALIIKRTEEVYWKLALLFLEIKSKENHITCVNELIKINPNNINYQLLYANHFSKEGLYIIAINSINKAMGFIRNQNDTGSLRGKAELYLHRSGYKHQFGDTIGAIVDLDSSLMYVKSCIAYQNKCTYYYDLKKHKEVFKTASEALNLNCDRGYFLFVRGFASLGRNDVLGFKKDLTAAINLGNQAAINWVKTCKDERYTMMFTSVMINK